MTQCKWVPCIVFRSFVQVFKLIHRSYLTSHGPLWLLYNRHWKYAIDFIMWLLSWLISLFKIEMVIHQNIQSSQVQHLLLKTDDKNECYIIVTVDETGQVWSGKIISNWMSQELQLLIYYSIWRHTVNVGDYVHTTMDRHYLFTLRVSKLCKWFYYTGRAWLIRSHVSAR